MWVTQITFLWGRASAFGLVIWNVCRVSRLSSFLNLIKMRYNVVEELQYQMVTY